MPRKKVPLSLDRLNERAASEFVPESQEVTTDVTQKLLSLGSILDRHGGDTRPINQRHVDALCDSISVLGLITPLTVDAQGRLLAGGHRRAALHQLTDNNPKLFTSLFPEGIPVRVMNIDSTVDEVNALQIEVEENTQRKNFTPAEIKEAASRLEEAGYARLKGRPRKGQKSLKRELASVFRLSEDRIQRILNDSGQKGRRTPTFSSESAISTLEHWLEQIDQSPMEEKVKVSKQIKTLMRTLERLSKTQS